MTIWLIRIPMGGVGVGRSRPCSRDVDRASCPVSKLQLIDLQEEVVLGLLLTNRQYNSVRTPQACSLCPRLASSRMQMCTYHSWMHYGAWLDRPGWFSLHLSYQQICTFVIFKLRCHGLAIVTGRWRGVPHFEGMCTRCDLHARDDEHHLVFKFPYFEDLHRPTCSGH